MLNALSPCVLVFALGTCSRSADDDLRSFGGLLSVLQCNMPAIYLGAGLISDK